MLPLVFSSTFKLYFLSLYIIQEANDWILKSGQFLTVH